MKKYEVIEKGTNLKVGEIMASNKGNAQIKWGKSNYLNYLESTYYYFKEKI